MNGEKDGDTLEQKIDLLLEETKKAKAERKKERVLSKVDGFYNVLIALSTFAVGILVSQRDYFFGKFSNGFSLSIIGIVLSMIISYIIGFKGMITDSMENRLISWGLLVGSLIYFSITPLLALNYVLFGENGLLFFQIRSLLSIALAASQFFVSPIITLGIDKKLASLTGQKKIFVSKKEQSKILWRIFYISLAIFIATNAISFVIANLVGLLNFPTLRNF